MKRNPGRSIFTLCFSISGQEAFTCESGNFVKEIF